MEDYVVSVVIGYQQSHLAANLHSRELSAYCERNLSSCEMC